jgi:hypothetical protein
MIWTPASARQARVALIHLGVRIALLEVDQVIFTGDPGRHLVLDLVDLGSEAFVLDETSQGFGVSDQAVLCLGGDEHAGAEVALIVLTGERVHLAGALQVDVLALGLVWVERVEYALHDEARQTDEFSEGSDLLLGRVPEGEFLLGGSSIILLFTYLRYMR